jgi:hypothetical protein
VPTLFDAVIPSVEYREHQCTVSLPAEFVINTFAPYILTVRFRITRTGQSCGILRASFRGKSLGSAKCGSVTSLFLISASSQMMKLYRV